MLVVSGLGLEIGRPVHMPWRVGLGCGGAPFVSFLGLSTYPQESIITRKILSKALLVTGSQ